MTRSTRRTVVGAIVGAGLAPLARPLTSQAAGLLIGPLLPYQGEAPNGLLWLEDQTWTLPGMAYNGSDPTELASVLRATIWQGNITRRFGLAPGTSLPAAATSSIEVSLHQLSLSGGASRLLAYFAADRAAAAGLSTVAVPNLADETYGLAGGVAQGHEATIYVRFTSGGAAFLLRVTGQAAAGDPLADVLALGRAVVNKA